MEVYNKPSDNILGERVYVVGRSAGASLGEEGCREVHLAGANDNYQDHLKNRHPSLVRSRSFGH